MPDPTLPTSAKASSTRDVTPIGLMAKTSGRNWLQTLLPVFGSARGRVSDLQKSMLDELGQVATRPLHEEPLARSIVQAADAETLWELRHALNEAIGNAHGELVARRRITEISFMFAGLLHRRGRGHDNRGGDNMLRPSARGQESGLYS